MLFTVFLAIVFCAAITLRIQHQKPAVQAVCDFPGGFGAGGMDLHTVLIENPSLTRLYEKKNAVTLMK